MSQTVDRLNVTLRDGAEHRTGAIAVRVDCRTSGINICPTGYGDFTSEPGLGAPIFLELYQGELRLLVWSDIQSEEPTHIITLEGARVRLGNNALQVG